MRIFASNFFLLSTLSFLLHSPTFVFPLTPHATRHLCSSLVTRHSSHLACFSALASGHCPSIAPLIGSYVTILLCKKVLFSNSVMKIFLFFIVFVYGVFNLSDKNDDGVNKGIWISWKKTCLHIGINSFITVLYMVMEGSSVLVIAVLPTNNICYFR
jgi:hypothetical protein